MKQPWRYGNFKPSSFFDHETILVSFNCEEGQKRFLRSASEYGKSFFALSSFFQPQQTPVYCGIASAVIVLNALQLPKNAGVFNTQSSIPAPQKQEKLVPFYGLTQDTFFNPQTEKIKKRSVIENREPDQEGHLRPGLRLNQVSDMMNVHGVKTSTHFVANEVFEDGVIAFRSTCMSAFQSKNQFVMIHFRADLIGGVPNGHICPLGCYDKTSDSVLVLDVASHKTPWYWVPIDHLYRSMQTTYPSQIHGGGYLAISDV